jgi:hypothetical protein
MERPHKAHPHQIGQLRADMLIGWGSLFFLYCHDLPTVTRQVAKKTPPERTTFRLCAIAPLHNDK